MTQQEVLDQINQFIVQNNNQEITANVLRPILESMTNQANEVTGELGNLNTNNSTNLVAAINELLSNQDNGVVIYEGIDTPINTPPASFDVTDYYLQTDGQNVYDLWQYNGNDWVRIEEQNNKGRVIYIPIDWSSSPTIQVADWIDANGLTVQRDEIVKFFSQKPIASGSSVQYQKHSWEWLKGKGSYGTANGSPLQGIGDIWYWGASAINETNNESVNDLGEIGSANIWDAVNIAGPYSLNYGDANVFKALRSGVTYTYLYIGREENIGSGAYQTNQNEYQEITSNAVQPDTDLYYDTAQYYLTDVIANANPTGGEDFVIIETDDFYYFGQKDTNEVDFNNCRLVIRQNGFKYDFTANPDDTHGGYNYWELESTSNVDLTPPNGVSAFSFFRKFAYAKNKYIDVSTSRDLSISDSENVIRITGVSVSILVKDIDFVDVCIDVTAGNDVEFVADSGVTIDAPFGLTREEDETALLYKVSSNNYRLI